MNYKKQKQNKKNILVQKWNYRFDKILEYNSEISFYQLLANLCILKLEIIIQG